jgi:hypothetical protein
MIIENCFSRLKRRWRILYEMPKYLLPRQPDIIMACYTLHNFIGTRNPNDQIFNGTDAAEPGMSEQPYATTTMMRQAPHIQDSMTSHLKLALKWPILEKALHKQCGIMHMETKMEIIKKMAIIMLK